MLVSAPYHLFLATNGRPRSDHISPPDLPRPFWISARPSLLTPLAIMLWIFLLQLINGFEGLSGAEHGTLCTSDTCFTLHMDKVSFEKARQNCVHNGGYLMTVRDEEEEGILRSLLSQIQRQHQDRALKFWIGLKLHRRDCVLPEKTLKGFKWVDGEEDSHYSNWEKEPLTTCTVERCVKINYTVLGQNQLKWTAGPCKNPAFYACKFYFKGMCKPLALLGPGKITYTAPFSLEPQKTDMNSFPVGTYADISCRGEEPQYSLCMGIDDIYRWTVPGPFCKTGKQSCTTNNGRCEHLCHQDADEVRCFCREGYNLDEDGITCRMKNVCDTCEHQCVMTESGYSCKCPDGFKLDANQRNCSDIDECEKVDGKCNDVDKCTQTVCEHSCLNSIGSFSCHCNKGFTLSEDGHSCVDVNECDSNICQFTCVNTAGSFFCPNQQGFHEVTDGWTLAPDMTETSGALSHDPAEEETQENFTESLTRTTVEVQHQSPHTDAPFPELVNNTLGDQQSNTSSVTNFSKTVNPRVIVCVLGSVIPLLLLVAVTLAIAIFRCNRSKKEAKKNATTDGYCWVSSGLDPRLEKLYESILTDDL